MSECLTVRTMNFRFLPISNPVRSSMEHRSKPKKHYKRTGQVLIPAISVMSIP